MKYICAKHGEYESFDEPVIFLNTKINPPCPLCEKERADRDAEEFRQENIAKENMRLDEMRIREEFRNKTLDNFVIENATQQAAFNACNDLISGKVKKVVLMGGNGIGKSHLGNSVLKILGGRRYTAYELGCLYRQCYAFNAKKSELELINELANLPFLLIDEVGRTKGSEAEQNFFSAVIDELHTRGRKLMLITNKIRKADCKNKQNCNMCKNCIECYLDNDVLSRLSESSAKVFVSGKDWRKTVNNN